MRKLDGLMGCLVVLALVGCDPGSKSVTGTADAGNDDGAEDGDSGDTGGSDDDGDEPSNPTADGGGPGNTSQGDGAEGGDDGPPDEPLCLETETVITDSAEVTPLGFSADDVIAISNGWSSDMVWLPNDGPIMVEPAGTTTQVNLGMSYSGGAIVYVQSEDNPDSPLDIDPDCSDRLELEVDLTFSTTDGYFAESFSTVGTTTTAGALQIAHYVEPDELQGMLSADSVTFGDENGEVRRFAVFANLSGDNPPEGSVNIEVELDIGDSGESAVGFGVIAAFPDLPE